MKSFDWSRVLAIGITIFIAVGIFYLSSLQFGSSGEFEVESDKSLVSLLYHFGVFFLFCSFLLISIKGKNKVNSKSVFVALLISLVYGVFDEVHQIFVPSRFFDFMDILANFSGVLFSLIVCVFWMRIKIKF